MNHRTFQMCDAAAIIAVGLVNISPSRAQSKTLRNRLAFEVASVKPSMPGGRGGGIRPMPGGQTYVATNIPLRLRQQLGLRLESRKAPVEVFVIDHVERPSNN